MDNQRIIETLKKAGLIDSEIKLYLALLELGPQGARKLSQKTGIKRANVYYFLDGLQEKGLANPLVDMQGIRRFRAEPPDRLLAFLESQQQEIEQRKNDVAAIIPELAGISRIMPDFDPLVRFYEGKKAVRRLYEHIFTHAEIYAIANIDHVAQHFPAFAQGLNTIIPERNITMRELVVQTPYAKRYAAHVYQKLHKVKILPRKIRIKTDMLLYDNNVAFIFYRKLITACVIEDNLSYDTQKQIFKELWDRIP